jgi:hypothetical protein
MSVFDWKGKPSELSEGLQEYERRRTNGALGAHKCPPIMLPGAAPYLKTAGSTGTEWAFIQPKVPSGFEK